MKLTTKKYQSVILVELPLTITLANADEVRGALQDILNHGYSRILMNMEAVSFVDSSGLAVLVSIYKQVRDEGKAALLSPNNNVRALLELTRLHEILAIYEDIHNALDDLKAVA